MFNVQWSETYDDGNLSIRQYSTDNRFTAENMHIVRLKFE